MIFAYSPFRSQERPGRPNGASGTLKKAQEEPMRGPKGAQKGPQTAQRSLKDAQEGPRRAHEGPKKGPKGAQEGPKTAPRRPQEGASEGTPNQFGSETPPEPLWDPSGDPFRDQIGVSKGPKTPSRTLRGPLLMLSGVWKISFSMTAPMPVSTSRVAVNRSAPRMGEGLPSDTQEIPRRPNGASGTLKRAHEVPQKGPTWAQKRPRGAPDGEQFIWVSAWAAKLTRYHFRTT